MRRKRNCILIGIGLALVAGPAAVSAQAPFAVNDITATIVQTLDIIPIRHLSFGRIVPFGTPGTVKVGHAGALEADNARLLGGAANAQFLVTGEPNETFQIFLPPNNTVAVTRGSDLMRVDFFEHGAGPFPALNSAGELIFNVGAILSVGGNQRSGDYSGTFQVTVSYE